jgi:CDP-diglyceride synthetase
MDPVDEQSGSEHVGGAARRPEGVRIIGADEAASVVANGHPDDGGDQTLDLTVTDLTVTDLTVTDLTQSDPARAGDPAAAAPSAPSPPPEMPHWSEPATGEMPTILAPPEDPDALAAWGAMAPRGPRWRDRPTDWEEADFDDAAALAKDTRLGALANPDEDPGQDDDDDEDRGEPHLLPRGDDDEIDLIGYKPSDYASAGYDPDHLSGPSDADLGAGSHDADSADGAEMAGSDKADLTSGDEGWGSDEGSGSAVASVQDERSREPGAKARHARRSAAAVPRRGRSSMGSADSSSEGTSSSGSPPAAARAGSGLIRLVTGLGIGFSALLLFKAGPIPSLALVTVVATLAAAEVFAVLRKANYRPATLLGLVATVSIFVGAYVKGETALLVVTAFMTIFTMLWYLVGVVRQRPAANIGATLLAFLWVGFLGSYAALLLSPHLFPNRHGVAFLLGAMVSTVSYDVGGYAIGSRLGRHLLMPTISPGKTWEGLIAGVICCLVITVLVIGRVHPWGHQHAFELAVVVSIVAPLGDLCESMIKRDLRIKDMGSILPGHGGVLDRMDAALFVLPATYYLVRILGIG